MDQLDEVSKRYVALRMPLMATAALAIKREAVSDNVSEEFAMVLQRESTLTRSPTRGSKFETIVSGPRDAEILHTLMYSGIRPGIENPLTDEYLNELIPKPWGYEYRVFADDLLDVWQLCLQPGRRTSMHSHPRKGTYLLCLGGDGQIQSLSETYDISAGDLLKIDRGAFHRTTNTSGSEDLHLIEVEMPRNKFDLVRLRDDFNRVGQNYESQSTALRTQFRTVPFLPGGKMCRISPEGHFAYEVSNGADLYYRGLEYNAFYIPLGIAAFLEPELAILHGSNSGHFVTFDKHDAAFLSVTPTNRLATQL